MNIEHSGSNRYTSWSKRSHRDGHLVTDLLRGAAEEKVGSFIESTKKSFETTASIGDTQWSLAFDNDHKAEAVVPDGSVFSAKPVGKGFSRAKRIDIDMAGRIMVAINENKNDWIIEDSDTEKVAQFSGGNNGVRKAILEIEPEAKLSAEEEVFLSWVARKTLEARLLGMSTILTWCLAILAPIILFLTFT